VLGRPFALQLVPLRSSHLSLRVSAPGTIGPIPEGAILNKCFFMSTLTSVAEPNRNSKEPKFLAGAVIKFRAGLMLHVRQRNPYLLHCTQEQYMNKIFIAKLTLTKMYMLFNTKGKVTFSF
jgi:hypothetical protein